MKIFISSRNKTLEITSIKNLENIHKNFKQVSSIKGHLEAKIFAINESISSYQLSEFKSNFYKFNICSLSLYSNNRETILAGKSLKINSIFLKVSWMMSSFSNDMVPR